MMQRNILATSALTNPNKYFLVEPVLIGSLSQEDRTTTNPKVQAITRWLRSQMKNSGVKPRPSSRPHLATRYAITYSATTPIRSNAARTKAAGRVSRFSAASLLIYVWGPARFDPRALALPNTYSLRNRALYSKPAYLVDWSSLIEIAVLPDDTHTDRLGTAMALAVYFIPDIGIRKVVYRHFTRHIQSRVLARYADA